MPDRQRASAAGGRKAGCPGFTQQHFSLHIYQAIADIMIVI
jgi:hypothetical protein